MIRTELPPNVVQKSLRTGEIRFYWQAPPGARAAGCQMKGEPLGSCKKEATAIATKLNDRLNFWRKTGILPPTRGLCIDIVRAERMIRRSKSGAAKRNKPHTITAQDVIELFEKQKRCCAVTGLPFSNEVVSGSKIAPFMPSIDRIDSRKGYHFGNVRLTLLIVNVAMSDWGEGPLRLVATALCERMRITESEFAAARESENL